MLKFGGQSKSIMIFSEKAFSENVLWEFDYVIIQNLSYIFCCFVTDNAVLSREHNQRTGNCETITIKSNILKEGYI